MNTISFTKQPITNVPTKAVRATYSFAATCRALTPTEAILVKCPATRTIQQHQSYVHGMMPLRDNMVKHTRNDASRNGVWCWYSAINPQAPIARRRRVQA